MSDNRPAFANSLVAMYGSSPETSDDDDSRQVPKTESEPPENILEKTSEAVSYSEEVLQDQEPPPPDAAGHVPGPPIVEVSGNLLDSGQKPSDDDEDLDSKQARQDSQDYQSSSGIEKDELLPPTEEQQRPEYPSDVNACVPNAVNIEQDKCGSKADPVDDINCLKSDASGSLRGQNDSDEPACVPENDNIDNKSIADADITSGGVSAPMQQKSTISEDSSTFIDGAEGTVTPEGVVNHLEPNVVEDSTAECESKFIPGEFDPLDDSTIPHSEKSDFESVTGDNQYHSEIHKRGLSPEKSSTPTGRVRLLRQNRNPSVKAAEAAADAAFVAAVTPTRKNLKEAKIASALAKASDTADVSASGKKTLATRPRRGRSSSHDRSSDPGSHSGALLDTPSDSSHAESSSVDEGKLSAISEEMSSHSDDASEHEPDIVPSKATSFLDSERPVGIKLKISRESVQILDPSMSKLEVQIPPETGPSDVTASPGGTKRFKKLKEGTLSPVPPLSPITLKIAKSKEGLEVVSSESTSQSAPSADSEGKVKITLKLSEEGATIVKPCVDEPLESRPEKLTLKLVKDEGSNKFSSSLGQDDVDESKKERITLKLSKGENPCILKRKELDSVSSSSDADCAKVEKLTLKKVSSDNVCIIRPKDVTSQAGRVASPESGKIEKITLKLSSDNVSIVKPSSPVPIGAGIEKLTLKMSKDGTAAVTGKQHDEPTRETDNTTKVEKITFKFSKESVSIVKPASPVPERKGIKLTKEEKPLSPLSPLIISRCDDVEPQKERITLKLSKAGGHPSPVGVIDERSSWSIKSNDSDNIPSPIPSDPATPKSRPKRALADTPECVPSSAKRLKLLDVEKSNENELVSSLEAQKTEEEVDLTENEKMDVDFPTETESEGTVTDPKNVEARAFEEPTTFPSASEEVIQLDSEDSQGAHHFASESSEQSIPLVDVENEIPTTRVTRRKPRGRPRKAVLTPGAVAAPAEPVVEEAPQVQTPKPKREKVRPEPVESDRPKRSCKGREKPPPKPVKPTKPRGRAALAKMKAEQSMQPEEPQLFEEETRMSADQSETPEVPVVPLMDGTSNGLVAKVVVSRLSSHYTSATSTPLETPVDSPGPVVSNEESQASQGSVSLISSTTESTPNRGNRKGRMEINVDPDAQAELTVDMIAEYLWPLDDGHGETYMIQEQISSYLGVKSFKRKYPNMSRRTVEHDERQYLLERKLVSESLCDWGLTALPSHEVLDVLCTDFPEKFEEYRRFTRERIQREISNKQKALLAAGGKEDSKSKAIRNMASFNAMLNRSRRDQRRCCFDLQNFTVHYPEHRRQRMTVPIPPIGPYPIALVPGQYTDYYKEYTSAELRYFPLNTVLYGPPLPHEMRTSAGGSDGSQTDSSDSSSSDGSSSDSDSSGSESDSDSDSSSESGDDSMSQTGPGTEECQDTDDHPDAKCRTCDGDRQKNKLGRPELLVHCASCGKSGHPSCLDLTPDMIPHIRKYSWHCTDCKLCAQCNDTADEDKMLFCDMCDRGYHIYCVGLRKVPEGRWHCQECALCASCGARDPGGTGEQTSQNQTSQDTPTKADSPQWQHEFKKGDKGARIYVRTLCVPCSKLWRKGRYCRLCWKCFTNQPEEEGLINCSICDRWMHAECCRKAGRVIDVEKLSSYICELCQQKGVRATTNKSPQKTLR